MSNHTDEATEVLKALAMAYGPRFTAQFGGADTGDVVKAWARTLAGLSPRAIERGLCDPPVKPPDAVAFRVHCLSLARPAPMAEPQATTVPTKAPARTVAVADVLQHRVPLGTHQWAVNLQARELGGERLTKFQARCWREALGEPFGAFR